MFSGGLNTISIHRRFVTLSLYKLALMMVLIVGVTQMKLQVGLCKL